MDNAQVEASKVRIDTNLIRPYTPEDDGPKPTTIRVYSNGVQQLKNINASHTKNNQLDPPTVERIKEAINGPNPPQRVVIESDRPSPPDDISEAVFVESLARARHIPVIYGEPDEKTVFDLMKEKGHSAKDVMAMYLMRNIPKDSDRGMAMDENHFAERAKAYLGEDLRYPDNLFSFVPKNERLTYNEFMRDYVPRLGDKAHDFLHGVTGNDTAPYTKENANFFQNVSADVARAREELVDKKIAAALNEPGVTNVLQVYGGAHRTMSAPVWEAALGKGVDLSNDPFALSPADTPGSKTNGRTQFR